MKQIAVLALAVILGTACSNNKAKENNLSSDSSIRDTVITDGLRFCEGTLWSDGRLLISNFGTDRLDPLNADGKGYIAELTPTGIKTLIPPDGNLSAPKGMAEKDGYLFIADVNRVMVYNLNDLTEKPQIIFFPEGELDISDLAISDDQLFASVPGSGSIYMMDVSDPAKVDNETLGLYTNMAGAKGLAVHDKNMYVASYAPVGEVSAVNSLFVIDDMANPIPMKFVTDPGSYDGITLNDDGTLVFFTNWLEGEVGQFDLKTRETTDLYPLNKITGPSSVTYNDGIVYVTDLPNSRLIIIPLNK